MQTNKAADQNKR